MQDTWTISYHLIMACYIVNYFIYHLQWRKPSLAYFGVRLSPIQVEFQFSIIWLIFSWNCYFKVSKKTNTNFRREPINYWNKIRKSNNLLHTVMTLFIVWSKAGVSSSTTSETVTWIPDLSWTLMFVWREHKLLYSDAITTKCWLENNFNNSNKLLSSSYWDNNVSHFPNL